MMRLLSIEDVDRASGQWLVFSRDKVLVSGETLSVPSGAFAQIPLSNAYQSDVFELLDLNGRPYAQPVYVIDAGSEHIDEQQWRRESLRAMLMADPTESFLKAGRAWQYVHFLRTHRYCGQCGAQTKKVEWEMAVHCHQCDHRSYPRVSPCIIVAIHDGERLLLAKGTRHRQLNMYSTLAGFVESGESLEQAVHREVFEEVGVSVTDLEFFGSQPWPFPHSLMVGFIARYSGGEIVPEAGEIDDAQWFYPDALPNVPPSLSIAGQLIEETVARLTQK